MNVFFQSVYVLFSVRLFSQVITEARPTLHEPSTDSCEFQFRYCILLRFSSLVHGEILAARERITEYYLSQNEW